MVTGVDETGLLLLSASWTILGVVAHRALTENICEHFFLESPDCPSRPAALCMLTSAVSCWKQKLREDCSSLSSPPHGGCDLAAGYTGVEGLGALEGLWL